MSTSYEFPLPKRILSIQSHVVSGYVGNKAAVFPLQLLGFDVDVVNSVHFSNHTGYEGGVEGDVLKGNQLRDLLAGLERNGLLANMGHILTGYIGSESFLEAVLDVVDKVRTHSNEGRNVRFVCDPVLGDHGQFYVPPELVNVYKSRVVPIADVLTPNQFEVEQLTGIKIETMDDAKKACRTLHEMGPSLVIITSLVMKKPNDDNNNNNNNNNNHIQQSDTHTSGNISIMASQRLNHESSTCNDKASSSNNENDSESALENRATQLSSKIWSISCPEIPGRYTGTGDLCAALLLAHTAIRPNDIPGALEQVVDTMYAVIERTYRHSTVFASSSQRPNNKEDSKTGESAIMIAAKELQLIQSKHEIENPPKRFKAVKIQ